MKKTTSTIILKILFYLSIQPLDLANIHKLSYIKKRGKVKRGIHRREDGIKLYE
ncbi:hypothetical protein N781_04190 [Pontibacillus halophilus JSM 076056 = DSM 19796]|uniref:Uncharacterized protein n=1 Tax=Pontibacillus halophilus JSM 076056 = DSM 19796 TaxID=1385510 RepID=A0A0A5GH82_9BACI|nr:hypothetical protein N781_04190 [Pontibacillus halophilus JSM 076056 = DSM 19796]